MSDIILAIDLGRYKSVACIYSRSTRTQSFTTIDTTADQFHKLFARYPAALVVIEACANSGWVHDLALAAGHEVKVANTAAEAWKFQHSKRKTDRDDALRLAELEALGRLPTVALPDPATRQRRMLLAFRQELVWCQGPVWFCPAPEPGPGEGPCAGQNHPKDRKKSQTFALTPRRLHSR